MVFLERARMAAVLESSVNGQLERGQDDLHGAHYVDDSHHVLPPASTQGKELFLDVSL